MIKKTFNSQRQKGFSMVELLLVFGVILGAAVLAFVAYPKVKANQAATTENTNLSALQAGIKNLYQGRPVYTDISSNILINAGVVPNSMINGQAIVNSFGAVVTVTPTTLGSGVNGSAYSIQYPGLPRDVCVKLAASAGLNFDRVIAGSVTVKDIDSSDINPAIVVNGCSDPSVNTITFIGR